MKIKSHWITFLLILGASAEAFALNSTESTELIDDCTGKSMIWEFRNPLPSSNNIAAVVYGNDRFVAIADGGVVFFSVDGMNWQRIQTCTYHNFKSIAFGAGKFVAVSDSGTIFVSSDGRNWHSAKSGTCNDLFAVTFGSGKFVATGVNGIICASEDAEYWTISKSIKNTDIGYIAFGAGVFVAASRSCRIFISSDAIHWQKAFQEKSPTSELYLYGLSYTNNRFIATGKRSKSAILMASVDGKVWERKDDGSLYDFVSSCLFANNQYYAYTEKYNSKNGSIYASKDFSSWSVLSDSAPNHSNLIFANGLFIALGYKSQILSSTNLKNWTNRLSATDKFNITNFCGIVYADSKFVLCDKHGNISFSKDGITWIQNIAKINESPVAFLYRAGQSIAIGNRGSIYLSPDACEWKQFKLEKSSGFMPGVSAHGICVAVGWLGMVITRKSDSTWIQCKTESNNLLTGVAYGAGRFVAVGERGTVLSSADGIHWSEEISGTSQDLCAITYADGCFIAAGYHGCILSSQDGKLWRREISGTTRFLYGAAYGAGQFIVAGQAIVSSKVSVKTDPVPNTDTFVGLWVNDDFSEGYTGFLSNGSNTFISQQIKIKPQKIFTFPEIAEIGESKESFIPSGWEVMEIVEGDLNGDKSADIAMVIQFSEGYVANSNNGPFISHPRIIMILFKEARKNRYCLAVKNSSVIIESSHPFLLEPFEGLEIKNKVLSITFSFFQSAGTWEVTEYIFKFRYQNGAFTLIGEDYSSSWRNRAYPEKKISCNYLTGKKKTTTEIFIDDNNSRYKTIWTDINNNVHTLDSIRDLFSLRPE